MTAAEAYERQCVREVIARLKRRRAPADADDGDDDDARRNKVLKIDDLKLAVARDVAWARRTAAAAMSRGDDVDDDDCDDDDDDFAGMREEDVERALVAMQDALERTLEEEERERALAAAEAYDDDSASLQHAIDAFERWNCRDGVSGDDDGGDGDNGDYDVLCPACLTRKVLANRHVLFCACGDFRLARRDDNVGLRYLKTQLAAVFDAHAARVQACGRGGAGLAFRVRDAYGIDALYAQCAACEFFEVVM